MMKMLRGPRTILVVVLLCGFYLGYRTYESRTEASAVRYEAPDDAVSARFTLMLGKLGNVRTTSMKAFPEEALRHIVESID